MSIFHCLAREGGESGKWICAHVSPSAGVCLTPSPLIPEPHAPSVKFRHYSSTPGPLHYSHLCFLIFTSVPILFPTLQAFSLAPSISPHSSHLINPHCRVHSNGAISMKRSPTPTGQSRWPALLGHLPIISAHAFLSEKLQLPRSTSHWPYRSATEQRLNNFISNKNFKKEKRVALQKIDTGNYR